MNQAIIDKIRKIQALADNAGTEAEAAAASAMVAALCEKHNLDIGVAQLAEQETTATEGMHAHDSSKQEMHWVYLSSAVEKMFDVGTFRRNVGTVSHASNGRVIAVKAKINYVFFGLSANVQAALMTYNYLLASVESMLAGYCRETGRGGRETMRSFRIGCACRIYDEAKTLAAGRAQQIEASPDGMALVRLQNQLVRAHSAKLGLRFKSTRVRSADSSAYSAGYSAGGRVNIHGANGRMLA